MEQLFELTLDEAAMAALGIRPDVPGAEPDEVPTDPWADEFEAIFQLGVVQLGVVEQGVVEQAGCDPIREGIDRIVGLRREMSGLHAQEQRELATLAALSRGAIPADVLGRSRELDWAERSLVTELALAMRVSAQTMAVRLTDAETVVVRFPMTLEALASGVIGVGHVRVIVEHGLAITDDAARTAYETTVLERAVIVAPGRLWRSAQLTAARLGEVTFQERHQKAHADRSLRVGELPDGMSEIIHTLPTVLAAGIWDRLTEQTKAIKNAGDPRTFDQIRSDLATELLLTGRPSGCPDAPHAAGIGIRAEVSIVIPALTLLGHGDEPASIAGKGPIDLETARRLAADAPHLVRVLTDPVNGMVLAVDTYRPSKKLRRFLRIRDGRCRNPSCNRRAARCDIDHTLDWQFGGKTTPDNLACLCRRHHTLKHLPGWTVRQSAPGVLEWTTPHGITVTDVPDVPVCFAA